MTFFGIGIGTGTELTIEGSGTGKGIVGGMAACGIDGIMAPGSNDDDIPIGLKGERIGTESGGCIELVIGCVLIGTITLAGA